MKYIFYIIIGLFPTLSALAQKNAQKAREYLGKAEIELQIFNYPDALKLLDNSIDQDSTIAKAYWKRGVAHYHLAHFGEARTDLNQAMHLNMTGNASLWLYRGLSAFHLNCYEEAIQWLNKSIQEDFNNSVAFNYLAESYKGISDFDKAIYYYNQAMEVTQREDMLYLGRGISYAALYKYPEAIADFDKAILLNYRNREAYHQRALAKFAIQDYQGVINDFKETANLSSSSYKFTAFEYSMLASCYAHMQQYMDAVLSLSKAIKQDTSQGWWYYERANYYFKLQNYNSALKDCETAMLLDWQENAYIQFKADILFLMQKYGETMQIDDYLIQQEPENAMAYYQRALCKYYLKDKKKNIEPDILKANELGMPKEDMLAEFRPWIEKKKKTKHKRKK